MNETIYEKLCRKRQRLANDGKAPICFICKKSIDDGDFECVNNKWMHRKCFEKEYQTKRM